MKDFYIVGSREEYPDWLKDFIDSGLIVDCGCTNGITDVFEFYKSWDASVPDLLYSGDVIKNTENGLAIIYKWYYKE